MEPIRVLMVGPDRSIGGGISALVETIMPALRREVELEYFITVRNRPLQKSGKTSLGNLLRAVDQYIRFLVAVRRFRPHIVHIHTSQGIAWLKDAFYVWIGKANHCRVVLHMHGGHFDDFYRASSRPVQRLTLLLIKRADMVIAVSDEWKTRVGAVLPLSNSVVLRNCIDVQSFTPASAAENHHTPSALFLGRVGKAKGAFDLLEALRLLAQQNTPLNIWVCGEEENKGDLRQAEMQAKIYDLQSQYQLMGRVGGELKQQLLQDANLFVLPSHDEALPMAILEAMASGLPIVSTTVGGIPELVREGVNGYMVKPGDVAALADRLARLAANPDLRKSMGAQSRAIAEAELDVPPYIQQLLHLYQALMTAVE